MKPPPLILAATLGLAAVAQAFDPSGFRLRKAVNGSSTRADTVAAIPLDADVYEATRAGFPDVRLAADSGRETAFVIERMADSRYEQAREPVATRVVALRELPDNRLEVTFALEPRQSPASGLTIHTPLRDYEHAVQVDGSADGQSWTPLVSSAVIFDYARFMDVRSPEVAIPTNTFRHYRLVVSDVTDEQSSALMQLTRERREQGGSAEIRTTHVEKRPFRIDRVLFWREVPRLADRSDARQAWPVAGYTVTNDTKAQTTIISIRTRREPLTAFTIETTSRNFVRAATVQVRSADSVRPAWRDIATTNLRRFGVVSGQPEERTIRFAEQRQAEYRIVIRDADSEPLAIAGISAEGNRYRMLLVAAPGVRYSLLYGSDTAEPPNYDAAQFLSGRGSADAAGWSLGPQEPNPAFTERRGTRWWRAWNSGPAFGIAIALMVAALAYAAYRATRRIDQIPPN